MKPGSEINHSSSEMAEERFDLMRIQRHDYGSSVFNHAELPKLLFSQDGPLRRTHSTTHPEEKPIIEPSNRRITWTNGSILSLFSA